MQVQPLHFYLLSIIIIFHICQAVKNFTVRDSGHQVIKNFYAVDFLIPHRNRARGSEPPGSHELAVFKADPNFSF